MIAPVKELARSLLAFIETRTRLAAGEIEEQWLRLLEIALWGLGALFFFGVALVFVAIVVVLLAWDANRILAAVALAALFLFLAALGALTTRRLLRERPRFLGATIDELAKDRARTGSVTEPGP